MKAAAFGALLLAAWPGPVQVPPAGTMQTIALGDRSRDALIRPDWALSADGLVLAVATRQPLLGADRNGLRDIYVIDRRTGHVTLETPGVGGASDGESIQPDISADGRVIVFVSTARNLTSTANATDAAALYVKDRQTGVLSLVATRASAPALSDDGETLVYETTGACGTSPAPAATAPRLCLVRRNAATRLVLEPQSGAPEPTGQSVSPAMDAAGDRVVFTSTQAPGSAAALPSGVTQVYLMDVRTGVTARVSRAPDGNAGNGPSYHPAISGDGRYVAFASEATNLLRHTRVTRSQIYLHDSQAGTTMLVSRTPSGRPGNGASIRPVMSRDGSRIAFQTLASDLVHCDTCRRLAPDVNLLWDVLVQDARSMSIVPVTRDFDTVTGSHGVVMDAAGTVLAYVSRQPRDASDVGEDADLFVVPWPPLPSSRGH
jgi:Tol biopolymer transport system component